MTDVKAVNMEWERKRPNRLMYLSNRPRPYGVDEYDTWNLDGHLAATMANGLRMLVAYGHTLIDEDEYERIASKLEFYAIDSASALFEQINWDADKPSEIGEGDWLSTNGRPGFAEYCEKSAQIGYWQREYMNEALDWLKVHWGELWD